MSRPFLGFFLDSAEPVLDRSDLESSVAFSCAARVWLNRALEYRCIAKWPTRPARIAAVRIAAASTIRPRSNVTRRPRRRRSAGIRWPGDEGRMSWPDGAGSKIVCGSWCANSDSTSRRRSGSSSTLLGQAYASRAAGDRWTDASNRSKICLCRSGVTPGPRCANLCRNQARMPVHSLSTVRLERPRTSATSSIFNPPKNRSSTIWACRSLRSANSSSASSTATICAVVARRDDQGRIERHPLPPSAPFGGSFGLGMVHQNLPHRPVPTAKKCDRSRRVDLRLVDEPQIGLVHQRGWLEGVAGFLQKSPGQHAKVVVNDAHQLVGRILSGRHGFEHARCIRRRHARILLRKGDRNRRALPILNSADPMTPPGITRSLPRPFCGS